MFGKKELQKKLEETTRTYNETNHKLQEVQNELIALKENSQKDKELIYEFMYKREPKVTLENLNSGVRFGVISFQGYRWVFKKNNLYTISASPKNVNCTPTDFVNYAKKLGYEKDDSTDTYWLTGPSVIDYMSKNGYAVSNEF